MYFLTATPIFGGCLCKCVRRKRYTCLAPSDDKTVAHLDLTGRGSRRSRTFAKTDPCSQDVDPSGWLA